MHLQAVLPGNFNPASKITTSLRRPPCCHKETEKLIRAGEAGHCLVLTWAGHAAAPVPSCLVSDKDLCPAPSPQTDEVMLMSKMKSVKMF